MENNGLYPHTLSFDVLEKGLNSVFLLLKLYNLFAQSAGAVEYTDCFSAEG